MTQKERIESLEAKVAELERRLAIEETKQPYIYWYPDTASPTTYPVWRTGTTASPPITFTWNTGGAE